MAKKSWNSLVKAYSSRATFGCAVSAALPPAARFDKKKRKLPTPFGLFNEWAKAKLVGDWASVKESGGFYISVADAQDAEIIKKTFGLVGEPRRTPVSDRTFQVGYSDAKYKPLALALGFDL